MKSQKTNLFLAAALSSAALSSSAFAARLYKDATTTDLNDVASWATTSGGATDPASIGTTDALRFNEIFAPTSGTNYTASLSADLAVGGIELDSGSVSGGLATGNVIISAGNTLTLNGASLADINYATGGIVLNSGAGGTLTIDANIIVGATQQWVTSRGLTIDGNVDLGSGTARTLTVNTATTTLPLITGIISGTTGNLTKSGSGTLYLNNAANSFGGIVAVAGGTLKLDKLAIGGSNSSIGSGSSSIVLNGGTLNHVGPSTDTTNRAIEMRAGAAINSNGIGGSISFTAANVSQTLAASARTLTLGGTNTGDNTLGSILGDSGTTPNITSLTKSGIGKWIMTGSNTYTGTTNVNAGTLVLGNATNTIADTANITINGGTLDLGTNSDTVGTVTLTNGSITGTSGTLTGSSYAASVGSITASLGGSGTFTKTGTGTVILSGTNTYNGATAANDGLLVFGTKAAKSASTTVTSVAAGTVGLGVHNSAAAYFNPTEVSALFSGSLTGFALDAASAVAVDTTNSGGSFDQDVAITGSRSLVKIGTGTLLLTVANSYTGTTRINQGTVAVTGSGVLGGNAGSAVDANNIVFGQNLNSGALQFETAANLGPADQIRFRNTTGGTDGQGGALVYTGTTEQTLSKTLQCDTSIGIRLESNSVGGKLTFDGAFSQTNRRIYLGGTGTGENTLATAFTGSGGITKRGAGTWILTGNNTYTGATNIEGGSLALGASNVLANTAVSIGAATLAVGAGFSDTVGTLDPTTAAAINLGTGATLSFASSNLIDWTDGTLTITGNFVSGSSLRFGDNLTQPGLTGDQLNKISAAGFTVFALDVNGFLTATPAAGFSAWAAANAPGQTINQDHDGDGVTNGIEYFMGLSGNGFTANPALNASNVVSWPKGATYTGAYGTDYAIQISSDLGITDPWTDVLIGNVTIDGDSVDYDLDTLPAGTKKFARLKVTGP